jgi:CheY-like chemotaxis protein
LAAKSLETVRLTEALSVSPEDEAARGALADHLSDLRQSARELGLVHLEAAVAEVLARLERESFEPASLLAARVLAWRYESLAAMPSQSGTHRVVAEERPSTNVSLRGRRVLVADGEAEVRWFHVGVLREAGARVTEARDGVHALEIARDDVPDLVLAAIDMPRLDGLGLCAAFRRDPTLDGVRIVLLSQPVSAQQILDRVSGMLEPLTRASIVVQDPWSLFDLELREGRIVDVTRTAIDGVVTEGAAAFPALVGMSSGRFVVTEESAPEGGEERESLDASFAHATRRLGFLLSAMATHPECRVELDQDALSTYVRHSPVGIQRLIARLVEGEPPHALWESGAGSAGLVDAVLVTLARQGAIRDVKVPALGSDGGPMAERPWGPGRELIASEIQQDSRPVADPIERENVRAQLAVAMHREPANQGPDRAYPIWRLNVSSVAAGRESGSGFGMQIQRTPRLLGLAFAVVLSATVAFLIWSQVMSGGAPTGLPSVGPTPLPATAEGEQVAPEVPAAAPKGTSRSAGLSAFAGSLRAGVDPSLEVTQGQGVLELIGPSDVRVEVDGVDRGALPVTLALEQGRHMVQYRTRARSTYRFYYVKSGATRALTVLTQAGGLVDAR